MNPAEIIDLLDPFEWGDVRTVNGPKGPVQVQNMMYEPDNEFWSLWRRYKEEMRRVGISVTRDDDTGEFSVSWWRQPGQSVPSIRAVLPAISKVQNVLEDEGVGTLDQFAFDILRPRQRKAAMTLFSVYSAGHRFALDASAMGGGKTYISLALMRTLGINFGVVCPANLVTKWTDTCIDPFNLEPEFILSYNMARMGKHDQYISRIPLAKDWMFRWNCFQPVVLIFDEVHEAGAEDSLNAKMLQAAISNPNIFTIGLSGTVANSPVSLKSIGQAVGLHGGSDWWGWAVKMGCHKNGFGGLEFTRNRQRAIVYMSQIHSHIFPERGCRLLKEESKGDGTPPHEIFVAQVDAPETFPKALQKYLDDVDEKREDDGDDAIALTQQTRERQEDELLLVPYTVAQIEEALGEEQSVLVFACFEGTLAALSEMLKKHEPMLYKGSTSHQTKKENLRQFQANIKHLLLLNNKSGSQGLDMHDTSGIHPRYSIILPTYDHRILLQAIDRTDRIGKKSVSTVEMPFLTRGTHLKIMRSVQRKIDNLSLLNDGELSGLRLVEEKIK